tara:strand:- start:3046 stop:3408 length:363 start_codon:yes stop_codon:yes gene_type:complete
MFIDKQNYNLTASGLVSVKSDDLECEIKFESNRVVLNIISINSKNLRSFFKLSDLKKIIIDVSNKLAYLKFNLTVRFKNSDLAILGFDAKPNVLQKIIVSKNIEVKDIKSFVKLLGGKSK